MGHKVQSLTRWGNLSSTFATLMFVWSILNQWAPTRLRRSFFSYAHHLFDVLSPYIHLSIDEFTDKHLTPYKAFGSIRAYLSENGSKDAKRLRLWEPFEKTRILCMDESEEVTDKFNGVTVWWALEKRSLSQSVVSRRYKLTFHRKHKEFIATKYLDHVINEGNKIREKNRPRRLFLNSIKYDGYGCGWTYVAFKHPATFDSLAMEPDKKKEIIEDLLNFSKSKEFYLRTGKAWKRGYLLYGPPGTGKSTLVAAMANLLCYDLYDLELTAVNNNTELKRLLITVGSRSIIVIEDIDCASDITGKRDDKTMTTATTTELDTHSSRKKDSKASSVTLSGLLNFIDGMWSSCGEERIIVFTTNHVKKLDPALIRAGRMDMHIELSYCTFEGFKVLAKNYWLIDTHPKFDVIKVLLEETKMTPADVAENLTPRFPNDHVDRCLEKLICALEKAKEHAAAKKKSSKESKKAEEAKQETSEKKTEEEEVKVEEEVKGDDAEKETRS